MPVIVSALKFEPVLEVKIFTSWIGSFVSRHIFGGLAIFSGDFRFDDQLSYQERESLEYIEYFT